jgi:hypothetical protein
MGINEQLRYELFERKGRDQAMRREMMPNTSPAKPSAQMIGNILPPLTKKIPLG